MRIREDQIPVPEKLDHVVEKNLNILYREQKIRRVRNTVIGVGSVAACFMGVAAVGVTHPAWAAQIPLIGHIFEQMQSNFGYPGDYSQVGTPLETEAEDSEAVGAVEIVGTEAGIGETAEGSVTAGADKTAEGGAAAGTDASESGETQGAAEQTVTGSQYTKTVGDMTVTLSEIYCNGQALNITMLLKSKEPFPDTMRSGNLGDRPTIAVRTTENYSFNPTTQHDLVYLEGDFVDEYTYAGLMRMDLNLKNIDDSAYRAAWKELGDEAEGLSDGDLNYEDYVKYIDIPEQFTLDLQLNQIIGSLAEPDVREFELSAEERLALSDEEWQEYMKMEDEKDPTWDSFPNEHENYWFDGDWDFQLDVRQNDQGIVTVDIGTTNEDGVGMEKIVKTPFEITMYPIEPENHSGQYYFPVMLDADGMLMDVGGSGGVVNTVAVGDHDVSTVEVYMFDDDMWMDEVKGYYWSNAEGLKRGETLEDGRTFKEVCDEMALYHETVEIPAE